MKNKFVYLLSICLLFFISSTSHSNELQALDRLTSSDTNALLEKIVFLRGIEKTEDFYILSQEKARLVLKSDFQNILELPEDTVLWLLNYGNDNGQSFLMSLLGNNLTVNDVKSRKLTQFTKEYLNLFEDIGKAYEKLTGEKEININLLVKALGGGSSPRYAVGGSVLDGVSLGIICYLSAKEYLKYYRIKKSFIEDISEIEVKYADLFNDDQNNPWTYALLSYSKYTKESEEYLQVLSKIEDVLNNYEITYGKRKVIEDGIIEIKKNNVDIDRNIRNILFDLPILALINYTNAKIDSAKNFFYFDNKKMMIEAGLHFAKTYIFLNRMVDDKIIISWTSIAGRLKKELNKNQYASLSATAKVQRKNYNFFNEKNLVIDWP